MPELGAPVRVTWELSPEPHLARTVWGRLCEARVLFVDVLVLPGTQEALSVLAPEGVPGAPRLTVTGAADELAAVRAAWGDDGVRGMAFQLLPPFPSASRARALAEGSGDLTPAVWGSPGGLDDFPGALALAREGGFPAVAVLNPACGASRLAADDRDRAVACWRAAGLVGRVELRVHDLFLAEAFALDPFAHYAGCQAAEFLAHVDARGKLVACRTLPEGLGDLAAEKLTVLWKKEARTAFRARLARLPEGCAGCAVEKACGGGCRGEGPGLLRDPSCTGQKGRAS